jgi:hypothetical protein
MPSAAEAGGAEGKGSRLRSNESLDCARENGFYSGQTNFWIRKLDMAEGRFERHRQPWTSDEIQKLHTLAKKGMPLKAMAKAMTRSEESIKDRAKLDGLGISKLR